MKLMFMFGAIIAEVWLGFYLGTVLQIFTKFTWASIPYAITFLLVLILTGILIEEEL